LGNKNIRKKIRKTKFQVRKNNGTAIWGGCVTRREHLAESRYFSHKIITVQGGYGMRFCSPGMKLV